MKKRFLLLVLLGSLLGAQNGYAYGRCPCDLAISTGYVWKADAHFRKVYGAGIQDVLTLDGRYWIRPHLAIGLQGSYWSAHGKTTVLKRATHLREVPLTLYVQGRTGRILQLHASLGTGVIFVHEKSYLGAVSTQAWSGAIEIGADYYVAKRIYLSAAGRYLYSRKELKDPHERADFGGFGLRAGLGYNF